MYIYLIHVRSRSSRTYVREDSFWMSFLTHMNESCTTHEWILSRMREKESSHTYVRRMSLLSHMNESSLLTHMNESCTTHEWILSHIWRSYTHDRVTHMKVSFILPDIWVGFLKRRSGDFWVLLVPRIHNSRVQIISLRWLKKKLWYKSIVCFLPLCLIPDPCRIQSIGWRRCARCLIFICHFPQKSRTISGSVAEKDLQLRGSYASSPSVVKESHIWRSHVTRMSWAYENRMNRGRHMDVRHCNTLQHTATHCNTLQHTATHCSALQHTATHCNTLQHTATTRRHLRDMQRQRDRCKALQCPATHCATLQHVATMRCHLRGK